MHAITLIYDKYDNDKMDPEVACHRGLLHAAQYRIRAADASHGSWPPIHTRCAIVAAACTGAGRQSKKSFTLQLESAVALP